MRHLRHWQSRLDCPHHPHHPNSWARTPWVKTWAVAMARAGNPRACFLVWCVMVALLPKVGLWAGVGAMMGWVTYKGLKRHTARPRPYQRHPHLITAWALAPDPHSFPSGHTLNAVVLAMAVVFVYPWLAPLGVAWIVAMGLSRVVLGLHYPSDVVAGGLLGAALGVMVVVCAQVWPITLLEWIGGLVG